MSILSPSTISDLPSAANGTVIGTVIGVVLEQVGIVRGIGQVVDRHYLDPRIAFAQGTETQAADSAKAVDGYAHAGES